MRTLGHYWYWLKESMVKGFRKPLAISTPKIFYKGRELKPIQFGKYIDITPRKPKKLDGITSRKI